MIEQNIKQAEQEAIDELRGVLRTSAHPVTLEEVSIDIADILTHEGMAYTPATLKRLTRITMGYVIDAQVKRRRMGEVSLKLLKKLGCGLYADEYHNLIEKI
jgi:hypothetical protein